MSITNTKPLQPAEEDAEIGLEIFYSSALPADRAAVNSTRSVEGLKNDSERIKKSPGAGTWALSTQPSTSQNEKE